MSYMSEEGYKKLLADLKELEAKRPEVVRQIAEARDKGDLSENAEYDAAKEAQGLLEMRINELKMIIADAKIIDTSKFNTDTDRCHNAVLYRPRERGEPARGKNLNQHTYRKRSPRQEGRRYRRDYRTTGQALP